MLSRYLSVDYPGGKGSSLRLCRFSPQVVDLVGKLFPERCEGAGSSRGKHRVPMDLLDAVLTVNEHQPQTNHPVLEKHFPSLKGIRVSILGLAFRPDTNDMRESPAIPISESDARKER